MTVNLAEYTIKLATDEQREQHTRAAFAHWGHGKYFEDYREERIQTMRQGEFAVNGALKCWVLVKRRYMEGEIFAGCESFRRKAFIKAPNAQVNEVYIYGVASVVTVKEYLRNGFGSHMLRLLHYQLGNSSYLPPFPTTEWGAPPPDLSPEDREQAPPSIASILWSDIGSTFYERATIGLDQPGWITRDEACQEITWKLSPISLSEPSQWDWIYTRDLPAIATQLSSTTRHDLYTEQSLNTILSPDPASSGVLSYVPSRVLRPRSENWCDTYDFEPVGIRLPAEDGKEEAIVLFACSMGKIGRALLVTYVHNLDIRRLPILLKALDEVGPKAGVTEGWAWGISPDSDLGQAWMGQDGRAAKGGRRNEIDGHLLGVAWYGPQEERGVLADTQMWNWC